MDNYRDKTYVYNRRDLPRGSAYTYIGSGSLWGNPFKIGDPIPDATMGEKMGRIYVVTEYLHYFMTNHELHQQLHTLHDSVGLSCYCAPKACHGDILAAFADAYRTFKGLAYKNSVDDEHGGYDPAIPTIANLPRIILYPHFYGYIDLDEAHEFEVQIADHTTGYYAIKAPTLYGAIRGGLELYFAAKVKQGQLPFPTKDEEFVTIEQFLQALTNNGYTIAHYEQGRYLPVAKDVIDWVQLFVEDFGGLEKPESDGDESG